MLRYYFSKICLFFNLLNVSFHQSLNLLPSVGHLIWGFYQIGSAEIDPLLNLIPLTFPKVEHSHKQLSDLYVGPLDLNLHFMA